MSEITHVYLLVGGNYKPGDQAPEGYLAWHEWAEVQHKAGLRQKECCFCCKWKYPQQLSVDIHVSICYESDGSPVKVEGVVCNDCADKKRV